MGQQADFTVYDGEATPVAHVFVADRVEFNKGDLIAYWQEKTAGIPEYAQANAQLTRRKVQSGLTRVGFRINVPIMEAIAGQNSLGYTAAPKVAYTESNEDVQWIHPRSMAQGRQNVKTMVRNVLSNVATTTAAVSAGLLYDAMVRIIFPS